METDFQSLYIAPVVAEERIRSARHEQVKLEPTLKISDLLVGIVKLFR